MIDLVHTVTLLAYIVVVALVATGLAAIGRALPWPARWLAVKPLSCALCMAFHSTVFATAALLVLDLVVLTPREALAVVPGATGLATFLLSQTGLFAPPLDLEGL